MSERSDMLAPNGKPFESVWEYPRPPRLERVDWRIRVVHAGAVVVDAPHALRVLETSQPPAYYVSGQYIDTSLLRPSSSSTWCEWKGRASYADVVVAVDDADDTVDDEGDADERVAEPVVAADAAWTYPSPTAPFVDLVDHWAFYAQRLDECRVDDELVDSNEGSFYGGWITSNVTGPFKGAPGTLHW